MVRKRVLLITLLLLIIGYGILDFTKIREVDGLFDMKVKAAESLDLIFTEVKNYRIQIDGHIDSSLDINSTGMIGPRFTSITTTLGNLESKRTSANPNVAAMVVQLMSEAGIESGDRVAVNVSGSFPSLNLAVIAASEAMKVETIIISSIGASTYGANNELLTYLDMESKLFNSGMIHNRSVAFSYGGAEDIGSDINQNVLESIKLRQSDLEFIYIKNFNQNIAHRLDIYQRRGKIDLFINVGGNIVSGGSGDIGLGFDSGLINFNRKLNYSNKGLIGEFLSAGVDVINILNIKELVTQYGISIDPVPIPAIGEEEVYYSYHYNRDIIYILLVIGGGGVIYYGFERKKKINGYLSDIKR